MEHTSQKAFIKMAKLALCQAIKPHKSLNLDTDHVGLLYSTAAVLIQW